MGVRRVVSDLSSTSLEAAAKGFYGDELGLRPVMDHGWIVTLAAPERPSAEISLMTHTATAPVTPDVSVQVDGGSPPACGRPSALPERQLRPHASSRSTRRGGAALASQRGSPRPGTPR